MKQVRCKSGIMGWQGKLTFVYDNFAEFKFCCDCYGIHKRLGYKTPLSAWKRNPTIQGSVNPMDLRKV